MIEGAPLKPVLARLYDMPDMRIDVPASLENERYDFVLVLPRNETQGTMYRMMREGITPGRREISMLVARQE